MKKRFISILYLLIFSSLIGVADVIVDFDDLSSFDKAGVYDAWEDSPFRSGKLKGNWAITENPDKPSNNESTKVLGVQRSRFGSNLFGARIDLSDTIDLGPETQYIKVRIKRPKEGRVMLIGLGSRKDRSGQNPYTEQFWELSNDPVGVGEWSEAVFSIRGADGVQIRSLVIVPDCESPHSLNEDFLFYLDSIELLTDIEKNNLLN